jgi:ATP-GRASP peptide maturase of grasp-with-spasm system
MILIFSRNLESSTNSIIEWIEKLGGNCKQINDTDLKTFDKGYALQISGDGEGINFDYPALNFDIEEVSIIWFRRWIYPESFNNLLNLSEDKHWALGIFEHLYKEVNTLSDAFFSLFKNKNWFDRPEYIRRVKKIDVLNLAQKYGLKIPTTFITNNRDRALEFLKTYGRLISKPISDIAYFDNDSYEFKLLTTEVTEELLLASNEWFYPTLFQQLLEKRSDLRVFYLAGQCYAMAILSQFDPDTIIDFRNYNGKKFARMIPYKLPAEIELSVNDLMKELQLKNGSLDFVLTTNGDHYFLEVNPLGQFGMTSYPCNYKLEKKIAQYLIENDK